jgi:small subunit ribosomal protein S1
VSDQQEDFAAMLEASVTARRFERGQTVEGVVVGFGPEVAFVDVGGKGEAELDIEELKNADGAIDVSVGDRLTAVVVAVAARTGGIVLSRKGVRNAATQREIEDAFRAGLAVEGRVEKAVKGGYEVRIAHERAFCPFSQIDIVRTADPAAHEGKHYTFRVIECKNGGKDVVLSRRRHLEEEQRASAEAVRRSIAPGAVVSGRVASVLDFGAFVDLGGGIQGLLHVSDMSWSRNTAPGALVAPGDQIAVKVLRVDEATDKISLGLKQLQDDPWATAAARYEAGQVRGGRVTRVAEFGAFVELEPGIEGLAHASTFPPTSRPGGWAKTVAVGMTGAFEILSVDAAQKRVSIALLEEGSARAAGAPAAPRHALAPGAIVTGRVERHERFGVFVFLSPGRTGLIPLSETGLDRDTDVARAFPIGTEIEVVVLDVDPASRRIRLSRKAVAQQREQAELRDYAARSDGAPSPSLGSLAESLRNALKGR